MRGLFTWRGRVLLWLAFLLLGILRWLVRQRAKAERRAADE